MSAALTLVLTVLWGGIVAADTAAFLQLLLSQPLVAATVTGLLWGRVDLGCEVGALLQLFALGVLPVGGRAPEDFAVGSVAGTATAAILERTDPVASAQGGPVLFGLLAAFVTALLGRVVVGWVRHRNERLARWVEGELEQGRLSALARAQWAGVAQTFAVGTAWTAVAVAVWAIAGRAVFARASFAFGSAYRIASPLLWGFGAGSVAHGLSRGRRGGTVFWFALVVFLALRLWTAS